MTSDDADRAATGLANAIIAVGRPMSTEAGRLADELLWVVLEARELSTLAEPERGVRRAAYERRRARLADLLKYLATGAYQPGEVDEWLGDFDEITEAIREDRVDYTRLQEALRAFGGELDHG